MNSGFHKCCKWKKNAFKFCLVSQLVINSKGSYLKHLFWVNLASQLLGFLLAISQGNPDNVYSTTLRRRRIEFIFCDQCQRNRYLISIKVSLAMIASTNFICWFLSQLKKRNHFSTVVENGNERLQHNPDYALAGEGAVLQVTAPTDHRPEVRFLFHGSLLPD